MALTENNITSWLHLTGWNLPDFQPQTKTNTITMDGDKDRLTQNNRLGQTLNVGTDIKSGDKHKIWGQP